MNEINAAAKAAQAKAYKLRDDTRSFLRSLGGRRTTVADLNKFDDLRACRETAEAEAIELSRRAVTPR